MKKILIVIPTLEQGGGQKFVMDLANGINKSKFKVRVLVYYKRSDSIFDRFAEQNGIDVVYLNKKPGISLSFIKDVKREVERFAPDVIHSHLNSMLYLLTSYKRKQIKLHTVHTMAEKEAKGLRKLANIIACKLFGVTMVGICNTVADSISRAYKIKRNKVPVVYNGVDCARYDIPKIESDTIRLISVGTIYSVKNFSFLVDAFAKICKEIHNAHLTLVGDGALRQELEAQIKSLDLEDKVTITGVVSDVENYLANADIYVASSKFEGLPLSMLEAMSAGLPIISTNVGGVPDIIKDGINGLLVASGDFDGYVEALRSIITNRDMREKYSANAKKLSKIYDEKLTVEGYERLYEG